MEDDDVARLFDRRAAPVQDLADHAGTVAAACHAMAVRFHQGGKLVVFGTGAASTDALHVAVEFVHPVIVGKRALPAISLTADVATVTGLAARDGMGGIFAHQIRYLAGPADIALGISADGADESVLNGLVTAHQMGSCRLGSSVTTSVADPYGQVRGVQGLYVADASGFPTASGVNPMLSVMALAYRVAQRIKAG